MPIGYLSVYFITTSLFPVLIQTQKNAAGRIVIRNGSEIGYRFKEAVEKRLRKNSEQK